MQLRLISNCDRQINFILSSHTSQKIKLLPYQTKVISISDNTKSLIINPVLIKRELSFPQKLLQSILFMLFLLFYYLLLPFSNRDISSKPDILLIDKIELDISSVSDNDIIEIKYIYQENELFPKSKIEYETIYPYVTVSNSTANDKQIKQMALVSFLLKTFIFIPLIIMLVIIFCMLL